MASFLTSLKGLFQPKSADQTAPEAGTAKGSAAPSAKVAAPLPPTPLAVPQLMATAGAFPVRGDDGAATFAMGMIQSFAGSMAAFGAPRAEGQLVRVSQNPPLFSVIGPAFGGDGIQTFALPDLNGRVAAGGGQVGQQAQGTLSVTFLIAAEATGTAPLVGTVMPFGGNYAPAGWLIADGSTVRIVDYVALFQVIGTAFGGDGKVTFMLPNLTPPTQTGAMTVPIGVGTAPGRPPVSLGQQVPNAVGQAGGLGLNFLICEQGQYPTSSGGGDFPETDCYMGQVIAYAGKAPPIGWALCDGTLLPTEKYPALYSLLGTTYGGDGTGTFALPDLRGRAMAGN